MAWVVAQSVLFALIIFLPLERSFILTGWTLVVTNVVSVIGISILARAVYDLRQSLAIQPEPIKSGKLQTQGIYNYVRHPMYVAVWLIFGGLVLRTGSYPKVLFLYPVIIVFFVFKVKHEERLLKETYPGYSKYSKRVGAFWPKIGNK